MDLSEYREALAEVLGAHFWHDRRGQTCECGWDYERGNGVPRADQYTQHQAEALLVSPAFGRLLAGVRAEVRSKTVEDARVIYRGVIAQATREARAEALREAAREAKERGDIGKEGGCEAWDWLTIRAEQAEAKP